MSGYPNFGTEAKIKSALKSAIQECKSNYIAQYGSAKGFSPRIVAVGICSVYYSGLRGNFWKYDGSNAWETNADWKSSWNNTAKNASLSHNGTKYTTNSKLYNGTKSLYDFAITKLSSKDNIRIVVLDGKTPGPQKGKLTILKKSANTDITDNNDCYSLADAVYGVYKSEADAKSDKSKVTSLKTKDTGWSNTVELEAGTYYLKEVTAPKGYALSSKINKVTITAGKETQFGTNNELMDVPQSDPVHILLGKVDKETNKNKPQGSASLEGAEFTVKYYKGLYDEDPATKGQSPERSWVLRTDEDGYCRLDKKFVVSGDKLYYASNGDTTLPIGTITIQESKAPTGYFINNEVFVRKITTSGSEEGVNTYNQPEILEKVIKFNIKKVQVGTTTPVSGAVFRHTLPNGSTEDLETNGSGEITITGLASGTHKIKEIKSPDGYQLNPNEVVFEVEAGTGKIKFTSGTNSLVTQGVEDSGDGYATFADMVNPFDLKITKTNEHGKVLKWLNLLYTVTRTVQKWLILKYRMKTESCHSKI